MKYELPKISYRMVREKGITSTSKKYLRNPDACYEMVNEYLADCPDENLVVIPLDTELKPLNFSVVSVGTVNKAIFDAKTVLRPVLMTPTAVGLVIVHNHPTGNTTPSDEDLLATLKLVKACQFLDITLTDHIVCGGDEGYTSIRSEHREIWDEGVICNKRYY